MLLTFVYLFTILGSIFKMTTGYCDIQNADPVWLNLACPPGQYSLKELKAQAQDSANKSFGSLNAALKNHIAKEHFRKIYTSSSMRKCLTKSAINAEEIKKPSLLWKTIGHTWNDIRVTAYKCPINSNHSVDDLVYGDIDDKIMAVYCYLSKQRGVDNNVGHTGGSLKEGETIDIRSCLKSTIPIPIPISHQELHIEAMIVVRYILDSIPKFLKS